MNKIMRFFVSLFLLIIISLSCSDENSLSQKTTCIEATVIGKFASAGGGVALSLSKPAFNAEKSRTIFNDPKTYSNVVQAFSLEQPYNALGTTIYFTARLATDEDNAKFSPISADGIPAKVSIVILAIKNNNCETI